MAFDLTLLPESLPAWAAGVAIFASFFTAALTAAFGLGGGLALLALMSMVFPASAVIPVHGVAQAGSNAGRFFLQRKDVIWPIVLVFSAGGVLGAALGGRLAIEAPVWLLRGGVGIFILFSVWGPGFKKFSPRNTTFFSTGVAAAFLSMFFGATGPIAATMLSAAKLERLNLVATHAACMVFQHVFKVIAFGLLGFAFGQWAFVIVAILISGFAGTALGTRYLRQMPENTFRNGFKYILTAIAFYLLADAMLEFRTN